MIAVTDQASHEPLLLVHKADWTPSEDSQASAHKLLHYRLLTSLHRLLIPAVQESCLDMLLKEASL